MPAIDTATVRHRGAGYLLDLRDDPFTDPYDADPDRYSFADLANWRAGCWRFVIVTVTPLVDGVPYEPAAHEVSGVHHGQSRDWEVTTAQVVDLAVAEGWCDTAAANLARSTGAS